VSKLPQRTKILALAGAALIPVALMLKLFVWRPPANIVSPPLVVHHQVAAAPKAKKTLTDSALPATLRRQLAHHGVVVAVLYSAGDRATVAAAGRVPATHTRDSLRSTSAKSRPPEPSHSICTQRSRRRSSSFTGGATPRSHCPQCGRANGRAGRGRAAVTTALVREASRDGQRIALLRCYDGESGSSIVEVEVAPVGGGEPVRRGPYRFATAHEAFRFLQEASLALQYLGCAVN